MYLGKCVFHCLTVWLLRVVLEMCISLPGRLVALGMCILWLDRLVAMAIALHGRRRRPTAVVVVVFFAKHIIVGHLLI